MEDENVEEKVDIVAVLRDLRDIYEKKYKDIESIRKKIVDPLSRILDETYNIDFNAKRCAFKDVATALMRTGAADKELSDTVHEKLFDHMDYLHYMRNYSKFLKQITDMLNAACGCKLE